ncbi:MAG: 16S rRNA (cytidine(1402)-2'-O)-methyltransferase [Opitutales bacterium]|nr:16S rRNA (cytidine(1402)-2'-O)-methyltransferase [Opitutales bacterium]
MGNSSDSSASKLQIVGTPIGNLGDLSERAAEAFRSCDLVACEDTRVTGKLLNHLQIERPMISYRDANEREVAEQLLSQLQSGKTITLVSDAGVPTISDPGFRITRLCQKHGIPVTPIPGPCAFITALSASGLPTDSFLFIGFLPPKKAARQRIFTEYSDFPHTLVFYESTHRIEKCLKDMELVYGSERYVSVAKELTKLHERIHTDRLGKLKDDVLRRSLKGEFVVMVAADSFEL